MFKIIATSLLAVVVVGIVLLLFVIPMPSYSKALTIENRTSEDLSVDIRANETKKHLVAHLMTGQSLKFVYFRGDRGRLSSVEIALTIVADASSNRIDSQFQLRVDGPQTNIVITHQSFQRK